MSINAISYLTGNTSYQTGMFKRATVGANMSSLLTGSFKWWNKVDALATQYLIYTDSYTTERTDQANSVPVCWSTPDLNDQSLINLINTIPERVGEFPFTNINTALYWLQNTNKYFLLKNGYENIVTDGLVLNLDAGWYDSYPGSGTIWNDLSGQNYNGTLINGPTFNTNNGGSVVFDGTDDYVDLQYSIIGGTGDFTVNQWIQSDVSETGGTTFGNFGAGTLQVFYGNTYMGFWLNNASAYVDAPVPFSSNPVMITAIRTGTTTYFYQNGVLLKTGASSANIGAANFRIGTNTSTNEQFNGKIFTTQVYNRAISTTEIAQNYNTQKTRFGLTGSTISQTDLMFHVDANNPISYPGSGNMWYDISGNNYDFTLVNSPVYTTHNNAKTFNFSGSDDHAIRNGPIRYDVGTAATIFVVMASINDSDFGSCSRLVSFNNGSSVNLDYSDYFSLPSCPQNRFNLYYKVNPAGLDAGISMKGPTDPYKILAFSWTAGSSAKQYTNGSLVASTNSVASAFDYLTVQRMTFAINANLTIENSYVRISEVFMYSRQMSDVEVTNTYNAIKSKYGL